MQLYCSRPDSPLHKEKRKTPNAIAKGIALVPTVAAPPVKDFEGVGVGVKVPFLGMVTVEVSVAVFVDV